MPTKNKFILIILVIILIFSFTEITLRVIAHLNRKTLFSVLTVDDPVLDWRLTPNYSDVKAGIYINSLGFRGREFKKEKEAGIFRIIALGDSCTFGVGSQGTTYPEILEKELNNSVNKYEVINAGVPGYTSSQVFLYLQRDLLSYKPDLILVYVGWNNIWTYKNPGANTAYSPALRAISRSLSKSLTFSLLRDFIINRIKSSLNFAKKSAGKEYLLEDRFKEKSANFKEDIRKIIQLTKVRNRNIILFTMPTAIRKGMKESQMKRFRLTSSWTNGYEVFLRFYQRLNEAIKAVGADENVKVIDLDLVFRQLPEEKAKALFYDAVHPNEEGLSFIAQYVSQRIAGEYR